jgi:uncharacterized protein YyaL (SSP411 family)
VPDDWPIDPLDQSALVDANAAMLSALLAAARLLDDSWALERARLLADYLCRSAIDAGAVAAHRLDAGRVVAGAQAADTYRLSAALLDAQDTIGVARYGAHAKAIFDALVDRLSFAAEPGALGGVNAPATPGVPTVAAMQQDAGIAAVALRLAEHTDPSGYRDVAMRALSGYQPRDAWGPLAAGYLNVVSQYLRLT